jgi:hypothetical protein
MEFYVLIYKWRFIMNRINGFGFLLAGLMALNVVLPVCAEGATGTAQATTTTTTATTAPETKAQETAPEATAPAAAEQAKAPALGWLQGLTNGLNAIKSFFIPKVVSDTEKMVNGAQQATANFEKAATKAGDAVTGAAKEVSEGMKEIKAGMTEVRGVIAGARQMLANGLAATKLDGLMSDESVKTLKEQAPLIFGVTVIGAALFAATWLYKAELKTLISPLLEWLNKVAPAPAAQ